MKRLLASLAILALAGFGCAAKQNDVAVDPSWTTYENAQYGFSLAYPSNMDLRQREEEVRADDYLGIEADFFASLRDTVIDSKPTTIASFYAVPGLSLDAFEAALVASSASGAVQVKSREDVTVNGMAMTKVTSSTEMGEDKTHYLLDRDGTTLVMSIHIRQEAAWEEVLATMREM